MKKAFFITTLICFFAVNSTCCFAADFKSRTHTTEYSDLNSILPASLTTFFHENGIDPSSLMPVKKTGHGDQKLFLFEDDSQEIFIAVIKNPDNTGFVIILDKIAPPGEEATVIIYDKEKNIYSFQQLSPDCVRQISRTLQSFVSTVFNCGITANSLGCVLDIIDLVTNLYLLTIDCSPEG
jgi:hypothetical protein